MAAEDEGGVCHGIGAAGASASDTFREMNENIGSYAHYLQKRHPPHHCLSANNTIALYFWPTDNTVPFVFWPIDNTIPFLVWPTDNTIPFVSVLSTTLHPFVSVLPLEQRRYKLCSCSNS